MDKGTDSDYAGIKSHPDYDRLVKRRRVFSLWLATAMLLIYYGFILILAFLPDEFGEPISNMTMTIGIPAGIFVILSAFILTAVYVWRANSEFDRLTRNIVEDRRS